MPATKDIQLAREAYLNLLRVHDKLSGEFTALFREHGLTQAQFNVLRILLGGDTGGLACQEIGERLIHRLPDVTRLIDRMEKAGLVERHRSQRDRRVVLVRVTDEGRQVCQALRGPVDALHVRQFEHLPASELAAWNQGLLQVLSPPL